MAVEVGEVRADDTQIDEAINRPQQVMLGNMVFQRELVEKRRLCFLPRSQLRQFLPTERIESAT